MEPVPGVPSRFTPQAEPSPAQIRAMEGAALNKITGGRAWGRRIMNKGWDPTSYGKAWAGQYDSLYAQRDNVAQIVDFIRVHQGKRRLLEFGVGTGRIAIPLIDAGFDIAGVDASAEMLQILRSKPGAEKIDAKLGQFELMQFNREFDVVLLNFSSIFLLPDQAAQIACFRNAARHLETGGVFIVEAFVPDHTRWVRGQNLSVSNVEKDSVEIMAATHDRASQTISSQYVIIEGGQIRLRPTDYRYAWPSELDLMAQLAGLELAERWAGWDRSPFRDTSGAHVSVYRKLDAAKP